MKIDAIMTTYNEKKNLKICIPSVFNQTLPPRRLVIVDAGSTDGTLELIKKFRKKYSIKFIIRRGCNRSKGRNEAIKKSTAEYIFSLNADVKLKRNCIESLARIIIRDSDIGAVGGIQVFPKNQNVIAKAVWYLPGMSELSEINTPLVMKKEIEVKNIPCECCLWRRKALVESGMFNEKLNWGEDPELHYRMRKRGWKLVATRKAKFEHFYKNTIKKFIKQQLFYGIGGVGLIINSPKAAIEILEWKMYVSLFLPFVLSFIFVNISLFWLIILLGLSCVLLLSILPALKVFRKERNLKFSLLVITLQFIKHLLNLFGFYFGIFYEIKKKMIP